MKYVVLSFDDGKKDFYTRALPILKKYHLPAVLNVVSDYTEAPTKKNYISWGELRDCMKNGIEVANHSANHTNNIADIIRGAETIQARLDISEKIGFASPHSEICSANFITYRQLLESNQTAYIRSGNCLKRDGYFCAFLYLAYKYTKSKYLYFCHNKRNIISLDKKPSTFFPSATCNQDNSSEQMSYLIKKMPSNSAIVFMFHSILDKNDAGYESEKWSNRIDDFEAFCKFLSEYKDVSVITHRDLCQLFN